MDTRATERFGVPSLLLMENAALGATQVLLNEFGEHLARVLIVGGVGQNGGDGWVVARQLAARSIAIDVVLIGERERVSGDAVLNLSVLEKLGVQVEVGIDALRQRLPVASCVVDGLFGTGLQREVSGVYREAIEAINMATLPVLALDLPSGVDADTGCVWGQAVNATATVSFGAIKRGLCQFQGVLHAGRLHRVSLGVPCEQDPSAAQRIDRSDLTSWIHPRALDTHKGRAGHVLVVAGSPGFEGAGWLAARGALRAGAGRVTLCSRAAHTHAAQDWLAEVMARTLPSESVQASPFVLDFAKDVQAVVLGPGLGVDEQGQELARTLAMELTSPTIVDADALTALGAEPSLLRNAKGPRVITPHPGEAARLLQTDSKSIQADRWGAASQLAVQTQCVAVLKGARTLVASPNGELWACAQGAPTLAVAGSGDVLSGVMAAICVEQEVTMNAASAAVLLHALAGESFSETDRGIIASEIADAVPVCLANATNATASS